MTLDALNTKEARGSIESRAFAIGGAVLLTLAGGYLWQDLQVRTEWAISVAALLALAGTVVLPRRLFTPRLVIHGLLAAVAVVAGAWFATVRSGALLPAFALALAGSLVGIVRCARSGDDDATVGRMAWYSAGVAALAGSAAVYFRYLTLGIAEDSLARRLVLTLVWLVTGIGITVFGQRTGRQAAGQVGLAFALVALGKALFYDTTHLAGVLRIALLAVAGVLMLVGALALRSRREEGV